MLAKRFVSGPRKVVGTCHRTLLLLALGVAMSCPTQARAWTEFLSMDVLPENAGWMAIFDGSPGSSPSVSGGVPNLAAEFYREYQAPANWLSTVNAATGYTIEFRLRVLTAGTRYPFYEIGVWYHDHANLTILAIDPGRIYISVPGNGQPSATLDATAWRTYRIVVMGNHHQIFVDGVLTIDYQHPGIAEGTEALVFGDLGYPPLSQSEWDYFAYETGAVVPVVPTTWGRLKTLYRSAR